MTIALATLLGAGLVFAQATGGSTDKADGPARKGASGKKATKAKKGHKGASTTPAPK
jgi:hypothetical protein